jgi:putative ABC transport system substrate-binding protein
MKRRELMLLLGGMVVAARAPRAQQKAMPVVGYLDLGTPDTGASLAPAFRQGLTETGYVEGQNVAIEYRWAEGDYDRFPALASDLVSRKVDASGLHSRQKTRPQRSRLFSAWAVTRSD